MSQFGISKTLINIPGCPIHPEWFVQTVLKLLAGESVPLDSYKRPGYLFGAAEKVHFLCPRKGNGKPEAQHLGDDGCFEDFGCRGKSTYANCPVIKWNQPAGGTGVNWCVESGIPCYGCTEPNYPGIQDLISLDD
jgi:hydrogenase small subunit